MFKTSKYVDEILLLFLLSTTFICDWSYKIIFLTASNNIWKEVYNVEIYKVNVVIAFTLFYNVIRREWRANYEKENSIV